MPSRMQSLEDEPSVASTASLSTVWSSDFSQENGNRLQSIIRSLLGCFKHVICNRTKNNILQDAPAEIVTSPMPNELEEPKERSPATTFPGNDLDSMLERVTVMACPACSPAYPRYRLLIVLPVESSIAYVQITDGGGYKMVSRDGSLAIGSKGETDDKAKTRSQKKSDLEKCKKITRRGQKILHQAKINRLKAIADKRASREGNDGVEAEGDKKEDDKVSDLSAYNIPYHADIMERARVQSFKLFVQSEEKSLRIRYAYNE